MNADTHRVIIGWLYEAMAMLLAVFIAFAWKRAFGPDAPAGEAQMILYILGIALLFALLGLALLLNYRRAYWVCLPFSIVMLVYFPVGTALGGYYIWYFWKTRNRQASNPE